MIWSRWRPDTGGYDYFESSDRLGLGDDLPVPELSMATELGVPSTEAGRPLPRSAKHIGAGPLARGSIVPLSREGLSGLGINASFDGIVAVALGIAVGWFIWGRKG